MTPDLDKLAREALEPFAALARERYPEEGGAPSVIDIMTRNGEFDELELRSMVAASDRTDTLDGADFRRALDALAALRAHGEAKAEPVAWATVRVEDTCDGLLINKEDAEEWGLEPDRHYEGRFLPDGRYRIALDATPPPPAVDEAQRLKRLLEGRDKFIVDAGLWPDFVATLPRSSPQPSDREDGGC